MKKSLRNIALLAAMLIAMALQAQPKDKVLNRPYADLKRVHFGFSVGASFQNLSITNNGFVTDNGESWFAEVPELSPGFTVGVLADLRLNNHFNLRFSPGMQFGSKVVKFCDANNPGATLGRQNVKSTYVVMPIDLKYSALRYHNCRPYLVGGVMGVLDVSKQRSEQFKF
ncbi:MAG: porin family protein, partial [Muribaculaceae bacterium]